ncbi:MAG: STAS domain-containing protein [Spirochaetales bacterium]|nr:STAS domain-containing protein [Spirochaetales bacterium]
MAYVIIDGNISKNCINKLNRTFNEITRIETMKQIIIDMKAVHSIFLYGIEKIIIFYKTLYNEKKTLEIKGISENICEHFRDIHLDRTITIKKV